MLSNNYRPCTLITICYGREGHLNNLLLGVRVADKQPEEIIIIEPEPSACLAFFPDLPLRSIPLPLETDGSFNVSTARNLGARWATHELLVFLDVDCIPAPDFFTCLTACSRYGECLLMGDPRYLLKPLKDGWVSHQLDSLSVHHPHRPVVPPNGTRSDNYGMFWSLCFAIHKDTFNRIGGFDSSYTGYGAEDTDFSFTARDLHIPLYLLPATAYHQQHAISTPPLNHFSSIISNCQKFHDKWGLWPMDNWLSDFAKLGLIEWSGVKAQSIKVIRKPTYAQLSKYARPDAAYA